jgi:hypothetical protein
VYDQTSFDRVLVHIVEFLSAFVSIPDREVIEAPEPEVVPTPRTPRGVGQPAPVTNSLQALRETLLDCLNHGRWIATLGLAHQQVNMLRHDYVTHHNEMIKTPHALQGL